MAVDTETLLQAWSDEFIEAFKRSNSLFPLINTDYQERARNADVFNVLVFETDPVIADSTYAIENKTDVLTTRNEYNASEVQVRWQNVHQTALDVQESYVAATAGDIFETYARLEADKFVRKYDSLIWNTFKGIDRSAIKLNPSATETTPLRDFVGTSGQIINADGKETGDADLIFEMLLSWRTRFKNWDMAMPTGEDIMWDVTMNPACFTALERETANKGEPLMVDFVNGARRSTIFGFFNLRETNAFEELSFTATGNNKGAVVASGGVKGWPVLFSNRNCVTSGIRFKRSRLLAPLAPGNDGADY